MVTKDLMINICQGTKKNGSLCNRWAIKDSQFCFVHDPRAQQWRTQGGRNSAKVIRLEKHLNDELKSVYKSLIDAMKQVHDGKLDHKKGTAMASLASAALKVYEIAMLSERLEQLEGLVIKKGE